MCIAQSMSFRAGDGHAVAGHHDDGVRESRAHSRFGDRKDNDDAAFLSIFLKRIRRQPFTVFCPLDVLIGNAHAFLPAGVEDRGFDGRAACGVRIGLSSDIEAALACTFDHLDEPGRILHAHAGDVHHMQRSAGGRGSSYDFFDGREPGTRFFQAVKAQGTGACRYESPVRDWQVQEIFGDC